jgi:DNA-directed RNA polymerase subunit RPC12/RpoP
MIRPSINEFHKRPRSKAREYVSDGGYTWTMIPKGKLGGKNIAWAKDGKDYYYCCPDCFNINKLTNVEDPLFEDDYGEDICYLVNGKDLDSIICEVCSKCNMHMWITLAGAVDGEIEKALKKDMTKCPKCSKKRPPMGRTDYIFDDDEEGEVYLKMYSCCGLVWRTRK